MSKEPGGDNDPAFEVTEFGRRRVSRVPKVFRSLWWLACWPLAFVRRWLRPPAPPEPVD